MSDEQLPGQFGILDALQYANSIIVSQYDRSRSPVLRTFIDELLRVTKEASTIRLNS